jgi:CheY-like chemotaxis protein
MPKEENTPSGSLPAVQLPPQIAAEKKTDPSRPSFLNPIHVGATTLPENFAHDLNNYIAIINGYSEVCLAYLGDGHNDEKLKKHLNAIHDAAQQAAGFTRQLLALSSKKKTSAAAGPFKDFPAGSESILIIEDEVVLRTLLRTVLEQHGYKITLAGTGGQGSKIYFTSPDAFDVILVDLQLPDTSGLIVLNRIKQMHPGQKVITVSGRTDPETESALKALGVTDHLLKPYRLDELGRKLREVVARTAGATAA